jgi:hypothetical protein
MTGAQAREAGGAFLGANASTRPRTPPHTHGQNDADLGQEMVLGRPLGAEGRWFESSQPDTSAW